MPNTAIPPLRRPRRSHAERSAQTQGQLLDAAAQVLRERSYAAASLFEVAKAAGVTPGAVQHHFGSKAELMLQLVDRLLRSEGEGAVPWPSATLPLPQRTQALVQALWTHLYEPPRFLAAWHVYFGSGGDAALRDRVAALRRNTAQMLRERFAAVLPELAQDPGLPAFVDLVLSALRGMGVVRLFEPDLPHGPAQLDELAAVIARRCTPPAP